MKQLSYFVALTALLMFASCQKEDTPTESSVKEDPVFTATIANDETKTSLDLSTKKVSWTMSDEITVKDAEKKSVKYEVSAIDGTTGKATFTKKSGETGTLGSGPYTATYGEAPSALQTYSTEVTELPMSAPSTSGTSLTFTVSCGLLKITLTQADMTIGSLAITNGTDTYTLTCGTAVDISSTKTFYICVPANTTFTCLEFTDKNGYKGAIAGISLTAEANHIKPVSSSDFAKLYSDGFIGYGTKIGSTWWAPVNCGYSTSGSYGTYGLLYQWGRKYGQSNDGTIPPTSMSKSADTAANSDKFGQYNSSTYNWFSGTVDNTLWNGSSKGDSDPCPSGWRVPTADEFSALISEKAWGTSTVGTVKQTGYWFNGSSAASEGTGVFLPAAGYRLNSSGSANDRGSNGYYWSSSVSSYLGRYLRFYSGYAGTFGGYRAFGLSVRCVQE